MSSDFSKYPKSDRRVILALAAIAVFCVGVLLVLNNKRPTGQPLPTEKRSDFAPPSQGGDGGGSAGSALHTFDPNTIDSATLVSF